MPSNEPRDRFEPQEALLLSLGGVLLQMETQLNRAVLWTHLTVLLHAWRERELTTSHFTYFKNDSMTHGPLLN